MNRHGVVLHVADGVRLDQASISFEAHDVRGLAVDVGGQRERCLIAVGRHQLFYGGLRGAFLCADYRILSHFAGAGVNQEPSQVRLGGVGGGEPSVKLHFAVDDRGAVAVEDGVFAVIAVFVYATVVVRGVPDARLCRHRVPPAVAESVMPFRDGGEVIEREDVIDPARCFVDIVFGGFTGLGVGENKGFDGLYSPRRSGPEHAGYVVGHALLVDFGERGVKHVSGVLVPQVPCKVVTPESSFGIPDRVVQLYEGGVLGDDAAARRAFHQDIAGDSLVFCLPVLEPSSVVEERQAVILPVVFYEIILRVDLVPGGVFQASDLLVAEHPRGVEIYECQVIGVFGVRQVREVVGDGRFVYGDIRYRSRLCGVEAGPRNDRRDDDCENHQCQDSPDDAFGRLAPILHSDDDGQSGRNKEHRHGDEPREAFALQGDGRQGQIPDAEHDDRNDRHGQQDHCYVFQLFVLQDYFLPLLMFSFALPQTSFNYSINSLKSQYTRHILLGWGNVV